MPGCAVHMCCEWYHRHCFDHGEWEILAVPKGCCLELRFLCFFFFSQQKIHHAHVFSDLTPTEACKQYHLSECESASALLYILLCDVGLCYTHQKVLLLFYTFFSVMLVYATHIKSRPSVKIFLHSTIFNSTHLRLPNLLLLSCCNQSFSTIWYKPVIMTCLYCWAWIHWHSISGSHSAPEH